MQLSRGGGGGAGEVGSRELQAAARRHVGPQTQLPQDLTHRAMQS